MTPTHPRALVRFCFSTNPWKCASPHLQAREEGWQQGLLKEAACLQAHAAATDKGWLAGNQQVTGQMLSLRENGRQRLLHQLQRFFLVRRHPGGQHRRRG